MREIWKFPLEIVDKQTINVPAGAKFLRLASDLNNIRGLPAIWAMVDPAAELRPVGIAVRGTGQKLPQVHEYLGSVHMGEFVWHVFTTPEAYDLGVVGYTFAHLTAPEEG